MFRRFGFDSPGWCRWPTSSASEENPLSCPDSKSPPDNPGQAESRSGSLGCVCFQIINLNKEVKEPLSSDLGGIHTSPIQKLSYSEDKSSTKSFLQSGRWYLASGECLCWLNSSLSPSHPTWRKVLSCVLWYMVSLDLTKMSIRFPKIFLLLHNVSETDQYKIRSLSAPEKASSLSKSIMSQG